MFGLYLALQQFYKVGSSVSSKSAVNSTGKEEERQQKAGAEVEKRKAEKAKRRELNDLTKVR